MDRNEWLKAVYLAACRVAEKHGPGLRKALESKDDSGELRNEVQQVAADTIASSQDIWPFIAYSAHPEPAGADWRNSPTFEGAVIRVASSALAADITDILESLSAGRALQFRTEKSPGAGAPPAAPRAPRAPAGAGEGPDAPPMPPIEDMPDFSQPKPPRGRKPKRTGEGEK